VPRTRSFPRNLTRITGILHKLPLNFSQNEKCFKFVENIKTLILCSATFFPENRAVYEIMSKNVVEPERPQMTI
jgi:hypothetical protein